MGVIRLHSNFRAQLPPPKHALRVVRECLKGIDIVHGKCLSRSGFNHISIKINTSQLVMSCHCIFSNVYRYVVKGRPLIPQGAVF